jgi:hypothetical protein
MADPRDARIAELKELLVASETARQAAEARVEILRQVAAVLTEAQRRLQMCRLPRRCSLTACS